MILGRTIMDLDAYVPQNGDLGVTRQSLGHNLAGAQLALPDQYVDVASVFRQIRRFFSRRVSSTDDRERLIPEDRYGSIADSTSRDTGLPVSLFARQIQSLGGSSGGNDDGIGGLKVASLLLAFSPVFKRTLGEIDPSYRLGDDSGAETFRLSSEFVHHLASIHTIRETGEVVDVGRRGKLATKNVTN